MTSSSAATSDHHRVRRREVRDFFYPEAAVGDYTRVDSSIDFYQRLQTLLQPQHVVLDFGAGRGRTFHDDRCPLRVELMTLKGKVERVVGVDLDPVVLTNPSLDEAHTFELSPDGDFVLPFPDATFDLVLSDWVFEHIAAPKSAARELARVLKPGGWLCARTPNRWGYIALGVRLIPARLQDKILRLVQPSRLEADVFPKTYLMNTRAALGQYFPASRFDNHVYCVNAEPAYAGNSKILWSLFLLLFRLQPPFFNAIMQIFIRKRA